MDRNEKIQYCLENNIFMYKESGSPLNRADLDTLTDEDLDKAISAWDKAEALGAGGEAK